MNTKIVVLVFAFLVFLTAHVVDGQQAIFLVRHAEDVRSTDVVDRPLTEAGHRRAMLLATLLKDTGISAIFTSSLQRTIKTAKPLATTLKIEPKTLPQLTTKFKTSDMESFVELLRSRHGDDIVLFVGHANTVPALLKALGHQAEIKIPETEYDNLFVVFPRSGVPPTVLRLRFIQADSK
jgi:phosphohistidine phosphatase SixA